jgi:Mycothiol maleylpyruvate isomerase N-terminal domain
MPSAQLWSMLVGLRSEQWATPSLRDEWDVHDVVAHLAATATLSPASFVKEFLFAVQVLRPMPSKAPPGQAKDSEIGLAALGSASS